MEITNSHLKGNIGESLVGAALVEELVSLGNGSGYFPLPVALVRVEVDGRSWRRQVHFTRVVRPSTEYQLTYLNIINVRKCFHAGNSYIRTNHGSYA